jgi:hypothetical protein
MASSTSRWEYQTSSVGEAANSRIALRYRAAAATATRRASATGYPGPLPADAVAAIYPLAQAVVDRTPAGMFGAPVDVGADAPVIDRLVALTGRRPRWG